MKHIKLIFIFFILGIMSCTVDETDKTEITGGEVPEPQIIYVNNILAKSRSADNVQGIQIECITIHFPFSLLDEKGGKHIVNTSSDFDSMQVLNGVQIIDFVYPLSIVNNIGESNTILNLQEFGSVVSSCIPVVPDWSTDEVLAWIINFQNSCFRLDFPVQVLKEDSMIVRLDNERAFIELQASETIYFTFPMTLISKDSSVITVQNSNELFGNLVSCSPVNGDSTVWNTDFEYLACYKIKFPIMVNEVNHDSVTVVQNVEVFGNLVLQGRILSFDFPMQLINQENVTLTVNSQNELDQLMMDCNVVPPSNDVLLLISKAENFSDSACYTIIFPLNAEASTGNDIKISSITELYTFLQGPDMFNYMLRFPISVRRLSNNEIIVLQSTQDIINLLILCP